MSLASAAEITRCSSDCVIRAGWRFFTLKEEALEAFLCGRMFSLYFLQALGRVQFITAARCGSPGGGEVHLLFPLKVLLSG